MKSYVKTSASVALIAGLFLALLTLAAPQAHAQTVTYAPGLASPAGSCPGGYTEHGPAITPSFGFNWCTPIGHRSPVTNAAECTAAGVGLGFMDAGFCIGDGIVLSSGETCNAPGIEITSDFVGIGQVCILPVYSSVGAGIRASTPACIESSVVQDNAAKTLGVGSNFVSEGTVYHIITGSATCEFNCHRGFDANCDDRLGDYCSVELNLSIVGDVGKCLEALGIEIK